jgi:hypothetical protein
MKAMMASVPISQRCTSFLIDRSPVAERELEAAEGGPLHGAFDFELVIGRRCGLVEGLVPGIGHAHDQALVLREVVLEVLRDEAPLYELRGSTCTAASRPPCHGCRPRAPTPPIACAAAHPSRTGRRGASSPALGPPGGGCRPGDEPSSRRSLNMSHSRPASLSAGTMTSGRPSRSRSEPTRTRGLDRLLLGSLGQVPSPRSRALSPPASARSACLALASSGTNSIETVREREGREKDGPPRRSR